MGKQISTQAILSIEAQKAMSIDVQQRKRIEACGILTGHIDEQGNWHIKQAHPLRNIYASPVYFEFAPEDLLTLELAYPGQIIGVYHSHPGGFAVASSTDRQNMQRVNQEQQIPWVWFILSGPFDEQFARQCRENLAQASLIAYYHSARAGLQQIPICLETANEN
ncbi:hypothetical protein EPA93_44665 [Ktedonosporobacter rubrisoli]|uniref:JAB domain-containing protein n=1 Tax=Ktedonosporobacter rubrisoli TaxID=2509675 RepID=A0A4P6K366_KTERU|nr:Mov34/MPN/PAD-1 family protein [Ktedonosporobacter rubrisoli]QBD82688.1 hypothetical protein EPA93_44665 [Ktedonosporobacter rubrisoli]